MSARLYLPCDSGALVVGADEVAGRLADAARLRNLALDIVRTGSRGLYWLELMLEVATAEGRIAYGPVGPGDVGSVLDAGLLEGGAHGRGRSRGTLPIQLGGNVKEGGLVETAFGLTVRELVEDNGGGTASGRPVRAVQIGGPFGAYLPAAQFDTPLDYEAFAAQDGCSGHGGVVVFDDTVDMARMARYAMGFCAIESCGKCTPCRLGSTRGVEVVDRIVRGEQRGTRDSIALLDELCETMEKGSLCALGGMTPSRCSARCGTSAKISSAGSADL